MSAQQSASDMQAEEVQASDVISRRVLISTVVQSCLSDVSNIANSLNISQVDPNVRANQINLFVEQNKARIAALRTALKAQDLTAQFAGAIQNCRQADKERHKSSEELMKMMSARMQRLKDFCHPAYDVKTALKVLCGNTQDLLPASVGAFDASRQAIEAVDKEVVIETINDEIGRLLATQPVFTVLGLPSIGNGYVSFVQPSFKLKMTVLLDDPCPWRLLSLNLHVKRSSQENPESATALADMLASMVRQTKNNVLAKLSQSVLQSVRQCIERAVLNDLNSIKGPGSDIPCSIHVNSSHSCQVDVEFWPQHVSATTPVHDNIGSSQLIRFSIDMLSLDVKFQAWDSRLTMDLSNIDTAAVIRKAVMDASRQRLSNLFGAIRGPFQRNNWSISLQDDDCRIDVSYGCWADVSMRINPKDGSVSIQISTQPGQANNLHALRLEAWKCAVSGTQQDAESFLVQMHAWIAEHILTPSLKGAAISLGMGIQSNIILSGRVLVDDIQNLQCIPPKHAFYAVAKDESFSNSYYGLVPAIWICPSTLQINTAAVLTAPKDLASSFNVEVTAFPLKQESLITSLAKSMKGIFAKCLLQAIQSEALETSTSLQWSSSTLEVIFHLQGVPCKFRLEVPDDDHLSPFHFQFVFVETSGYSNTRQLPSQHNYEVSNSMHDRRSLSNWVVFPSYSDRLGLECSEVVSQTKTGIRVAVPPTQREALKFFKNCVWNGLVKMHSVAESLKDLPDLQDVCSVYQTHIDWQIQLHPSMIKILDWPYILMRICIDLNQSHFIIRLLHPAPHAKHRFIRFISDILRTVQPILTSFLQSQHTQAVRAPVLQELAHILERVCFVSFCAYSAAIKLKNSVGEVKTSVHLVNKDTIRVVFSKFSVLVLFSRAASHDNSLEFIIKPDLDGEIFGATPWCCDAVNKFIEIQDNERNNERDGFQTQTPRDTQSKFPDNIDSLQLLFAKLIETNAMERINVLAEVLGVMDPTERIDEHTKMAKLQRASLRAKGMTCVFELGVWGEGSGDRYQIQPDSDPFADWLQHKYIKQHVYQNNVWSDDLASSVLHAIALTKHELAWLSSFETRMPTGKGPRLVVARSGFNHTPAIQHIDGDLAIWLQIGHSSAQQHLLQILVTGISPDHDRAVQATLSPGKFGEDVVHNIPETEQICQQLKLIFFDGLITRNIGEIRTAHFNACQIYEYVDVGSGQIFMLLARMTMILLDYLLQMPQMEKTFQILCGNTSSNKSYSHQYMSHMFTIADKSSSLAKACQEHQLPNGLPSGSSPGTKPSLMAR